MTTILNRPARLSEHGFRDGGTFTVGAEEELFLLDPRGTLDAGAHHLIDDLACSVPAGRGVVTHELFAAQIEFATSVCTDAAEIAGDLSVLRSCLVRAGARPMAAGLHPAAPFGEAALTDAERYRFIGDSLAGLLRTPTAAFQVHVGVPDAEAGVLAYRGTRHALAVLQGLAATSPLWHGRDSGLASARWATIRSYPRGGVPPVVRSWEEYAALVDLVASAADLPDYTHVWWDARLQPRLGTIEIRVMDAQPSLSRAAGLAALVQGLVRHAVENPVAFDVPSPVLEENGFRTARHGMETSVTDVDGTRRPVRELATRMLAQARAGLEADGRADALEEVERLLREEPEYVRHRRLLAEGGVQAVVDDLVSRTIGAT